MMTDEHGLPPLRVLVVDDEPSICRALSIALRRAGCDAVVALDGDSALAVLHSRPVDVLVLDLRMPEPRGDTLFHLAAAIQPHLRRQSLFVTGDVTERADAIIRDCGVPYLRKPFDLDDVIQAVLALAPPRSGTRARDGSTG